MTSAPRGPRYNPPGLSPIGAPRGPRYNPPVHRPQVPAPRGPRYNNPRKYYETVHRHYIYRSWILYPVYFTYYDGYWDMEDYPYYVYNGYRHRYSSVETCKYELVDGDSYAAVKQFGELSCNLAYDQCAIERDGLNSSLGVERYFCAEAVDADLVSADDSLYRTTPVDLNESKSAAIGQYLSGKSLKDIFKDGYRGGVNGCLVWKLKGNENKCKFIVTVKDEYFPDVEGNICSRNAQLAGCKVGSEEENVGCIMKKAIELGYCH